MTCAKRRIGRYLFAFATCLLAAAEARAQNPLDKMIQLNKKALDDYEILEFEAAKKALLEAIKLGQRSGLESHDMMARSYVHLGVIYINGFKDRYRGFQQFSKALQIKASIKVEKSLQTPEMNEVFESALEDARAKGLLAPPPTKAAAAPRKTAPALEEDEEEEAVAKKPKPAAKAPAPAPAARAPKRPAAVQDADEEDEEEDPGKTAAAKAAPKQEPKKVEIEEPDMPANVTGIECPNADEAPPEKDIALRCAVHPSLGVSKVFLHYRQAGREAFEPVLMVQSKKGWYNGVIPGKAVTGKSLQYYYVGQNKQGKAIISKGRDDSPELMIIREGAQVVGTGATAILQAQKQSDELTFTSLQEENPLEEKSAKPAAPKIVLGAKPVRPEDKVKAMDDRTFWVGVAIGSGLGWARGEPEYSKHWIPEVQQGVAPALMGHAAPEIGYYLKPKLAISIQARNQWIRRPPDIGTASGSHFVFLRGLFFSGTGKDRFYASAMAGSAIGGLATLRKEGFRLTVRPDRDNPELKDTVRGGFLAAGGGLGFTHALTPWWSLVAEVNLLVGVPQVAAVADLNIGGQFTY